MANKSTPRIVRNTSSNEPDLTDEDFVTPNLDEETIKEEEVPGVSTDDVKTAGDEDTKKPHTPNWIPEGTRVEIEQNGEAVNPFNGEKLTKDDLPK